MSAFRDVAYDADHEVSICCHQRAQADFYREFCAVLAQSEQLKTGSHGPGTRVGEKILLFFWMFAAEPFRHQHVDRLPEQFLALPAKQL